MRATFLILLLTAGCGTEGGFGGGTDHPPNSQLGPYAPLTGDQAPTLVAPTVLSSGLVDYDDPDAIVGSDGKSVVLYVTERDGASASIARSSTSDLLMGFVAPQSVLVADQSWEAGSVAHPSLLKLSDGSWLLFYAGGDGLGVARAPAGAVATVTFQKLGELLTPDADEVALSSPSAVQIGSRLRIYYVAQRQVWAADSALSAWSGASVGNLPALTRLDAKTGTAVRDPFVIASGPVDAFVDQARARVMVTAAGRDRFDVYFSGPPAGTTSGVGLAAFAAEYADDAPMAVTTNALVISPGASAPDVLPYAGDAVLFYGLRSGDHSGIALALGPQVAF